MVDEWLAEVASGLSSDQLLDLLEQAVRAVWDSARTCINDVILCAVLERVVINARRHFTWLPPLPIADDSIDASALRAHSTVGNPSAIYKVVRFIVTEFVSINGNLTGETLSKTMHRTLAGVRWRKPSSEN